MHWNSILLLFPRLPFFFCFINYSLFQGSVTIRTIISHRLKPYIYKYSVRARVSQTVDWTQIRTAPQIHAAKLIQISSKDFNDTPYNRTLLLWKCLQWPNLKQSESCLASPYMTGRETPGSDSRLDWRT